MTAGPPGLLVLDRAEVSRLLDPDLLQEEIALALRSSPASDTTSFREVLPVPDGACHVVGGTATVGGTSLVGIKVNGRYDTGSMRGSLLLVDGAAGAPVCLMDSAALTTARTAAMVGLVVRELAPPGSRRALVVGAGRLAAPVAEALLGRGVFDEIAVWARRPERARAVAHPYVDDRVRAVANLREASVRADVVVCITSSSEPLVTAPMVRPGALVVAAGSDAPGKREIAADLMAAAAVVVDSLEQSIRHGEVANAVRDGSMALGDVRGTVAEALQGSIEVRRETRNRVVVDLTGMALQDVVAGALVCAAALERGVGRVVPVG